jgi:hypothetical protein
LESWNPTQVLYARSLLQDLVSICDQQKAAVNDHEVYQNFSDSTFETLSKNHQSLINKLNAMKQLLLSSKGQTELVSVERDLAYEKLAKLRQTLERIIQYIGPQTF